MAFSPFFTAGGHGRHRAGQNQDTAFNPAKYQRQSFAGHQFLDLRRLVVGPDPGVSAARGSSDAAGQQVELGPAGAVGHGGLGGTEFGFHLRGRHVSVQARVEFGERALEDAQVALRVCGGEFGLGLREAHAQAEQGDDELLKQFHSGTRHGSDDAQSICQGAQ